MKPPQTIPAGADPRWPAGRPAAPGSAFHWARGPSQIGALLQAHGVLSQSSTRTVAAARERGAAPGAIYGISRKADERLLANKARRTRDQTP